MSPRSRRNADDATAAFSASRPDGSPWVSAALFRIKRDERSWIESIGWQEQAKFEADFHRGGNDGLSLVGRSWPANGREPAQSAVTFCDSFQHRCSVVSLESGCSSGDRNVESTDI